MEVEFKAEVYDRLETDGKFTAGFPGPIVSMYRRRLQLIRSAVDERDFYALRSLRFEKLKGDRAGQYSMRLNSQWRLVLELRGKALEKLVFIVEIVDYHS